MLPTSKALKKLHTSLSLASIPNILITYWKKKERWFMRVCRAGWSPTNIQARYPSTTQSGRCALLASRDTLLSNTRAAQPSGRTSLVTPDLERAGHPQAPCGPYPASHVYTSLPPARVTGGCYTTQLSCMIWNMPYIDALNLRCNSYGFGEALVLGSDRGDFWA